MDTTILFDSVTELIMVIISIGISRYLIPFLIEKYSAQKVSNTYEKVMMAVKAAQKIYQESGQGALRKEYVLDYLNNTLKLKIDIKELDVLIESAVKTLDLLEAELKRQTEVK